MNVTKSYVYAEDVSQFKLQLGLSLRLSIVDDQHLNDLGQKMC